MQAPNRNWQGAAAQACRILMVMLVAWMYAAAGVEATEKPSDTPAPKSSGEYRMTQGDYVALVVFNEPQLSGDFIVDDAGQILMPLLGAVRIGGLTQAEAQKLIQDRLADGILVQPTVSLRIKEYRAVSIFGNVKKPGSYPFHFGQTVRAVIAIAGGEGRLSELPNAAMSEYILADERVRLLEARNSACSCASCASWRSRTSPRISWCHSSSASTPTISRSACTMRPRTRFFRARWKRIVINAICCRSSNPVSKPK